MKRQGKITIFGLLLAFAISPVIGCNQPAIQALDHYQKTEQTVITDLSNVAIQQSLDAAAKKVEEAVAAGDSAGAVKALVDHNHLCETVMYLITQHERGKSIFLLARTYIASQRSYLEVLVEDVKEAKERSDANQ